MSATRMVGVKIPRFHGNPIDDPADGGHEPSDDSAQSSQTGRQADQSYQKEPDGSKRAVFYTSTNSFCHVASFNASR